MRDLKKSRYRQKKCDLNLTPLIDTFATLLIIFIIAAPIVKNAIKVDLPQGKVKEGQGLDDNIVTITRDNIIFFNNAQVSSYDLIKAAQKIMAHDHDAPIYVHADEAVAYGDVIKIVDELKMAGVHYVAMSTKQ